MLRSSRHRAVVPAALRPVRLLLAVVTVVGSVSLAGSLGPAHAAVGAVAPVTAPVAAAAKVVGAEIYGHAYGPGNTRAHVRVSLFRADWTYLRSVSSTRGGAYRMPGVAAGTYRLQFADLRPRWDTGSFATRDVVVRIPSGVPSVRADAHLQRGASLTGKATAGGRPARGALVRAVSSYGATYESRADRAGGFAVAGLPAGDYSVFVYDRQRRYAGKSTWVGKLERGGNANLRLTMPKRAGAYSGFLMVGGTPARGTIYVTAVSRRTGQFWVTRVVDGDLSSVRGLYPGGYRLEIPATAQTAAQTVSLPPVRSGKVRVVYVHARRP